MSMSRAELEAMDRDELVETVVELGERVDDLEERLERHQQTTVTQTTLNHLLGALTGTEPENFNGDPMQMLDAATHISRLVDEYNDRLKRLENIAEEEETLTGDTKLTNWQQIIRKAENLQNHPEHGMPNNRVKLKKKEIAGAVGCTERHALDLIDDYADDYEDGVEKQPYKQITTSRTTESAGIQPKALIIDLGVWGEKGE